MPKRVGRIKAELSISISREVPNEMNATVKAILGWDRRTEAEKVVLRRIRYMHHHAARIAWGSCASNFVSAAATPPWLRRKLASFFVEKAIEDGRLGSDARALQAAREAISLDPSALAYDTLAGALLPGENYHALLRRFHAWRRPRNYIEIGVRSGASIMLAKPPTIAVGIDPEPQLVCRPGTVCKIFPLTSDEYFAARDPRHDLEAPTVDMAFLDGLHQFEQTLRDFINIERFSSPNTIVLIHDCFALDGLTAQRARSTAFWTGDVWKIIPCLREFRPDLRVFTIATAPSGLGVVTKLDAQSTVLNDRFEEIVSRYVSMAVEPDERRRRDNVAMVPNHWAAITDMLSS